MTSDIKKIRSILRQSKRNWSNLSEDLHRQLESKAELTIVVEGQNEDEAAALAARVRDALGSAGYEGRILQPDLLEKGFDIDRVALVVAVTALFVDVYGGDLKAKLSKSSRAIVKALLSVSGNFSAEENREFVDYGILEEWLDGKYGAGNWELDLHQITYKPIANVDVVDFVEIRSGIGRRLVIDHRTFQAQEVEVDPNE